MIYTPTRRGVIGLGSAALTAALVALAWPANAPAAQQPVYSDEAGLAIRGYDPVAYFTEGAPTPGKPEFTHQWNNTTWRFASAANRDTFAAAPESYAPQFGGYCAWAVSRGYTAEVDPTAWAIVDGKLYLNYSHDVQADWNEDRPGNIAKGEENWPKVLN